MSNVTCIGRTLRQRSLGLNADNTRLRTKEELRGRGWKPHFPAGFEFDIWDVSEDSINGISEPEHRDIMNRRLDAKPFDKLRPRTQTEILEANRESVMIMRECGDRPYIIARHWGVTTRTVDNFFKAKDMKEAG